MIETIAAIIVTHNRLELLKSVIEAVRQQTRRVDEIVVVNNASTDGTGEWLADRSGITVINQDNPGSSGGQYTGIKYSFDKGHTWIWTMDDDVVASSDCLEKLFEIADGSTIAAPLRFNDVGSVFYNEAIAYNLTNPLKSFWVEILTEEHLVSPVIPAVGITFEGPLLHRNVIKRIGLPNRKFFIYADDTEYFIRAWKAGFSIVIARDAHITRRISCTATASQWSWKHYYMIRNIIAIDVLHGTLPVRIIRPFAYLIKWLCRANSGKDIKTTLKSFIDGYFFR